MDPADPRRQRDLRPALAGVLFAALATGLDGAVWGVGDHGIFAAFARPALPPDGLAEAARHHPSVLWTIARWLPGGGITLLLGLLAARAATGAALFGLASTLAGRRAAWSAIVLLAPAFPALGGAPTHDPLLLPRGVALPFELLALTAALRGKTAWPLAAAALLIHAPSGAATFAAVAAIAPGRGVLLAGLGAALLIGPSWGARIDPAWWEIVVLRVGHHVDPACFPALEWATAAATCGLAALGAARRDAVGTRLRRAVLALALFGPVLSLGLGRAGGLAVAHQVEPWQASRLLVFVAISSAVASRHRIAFVLLWASLLAARAGLPGRAFGDPGDPDERAVAGFLRGETGAVRVPPQAFGDLRAHAPNPVTLTWKDGGEALFDRDFAFRWRAEMLAAAPCAEVFAPIGRGTASERTRELRGRLAACRARVRPGGGGTETFEVTERADADGAVIFRAGPYRVMRR
jgi:hypothetical protein